MSVPLSPEPASRLAELLARYDEVKERADAANDALKALTEAIKVESTQAHPGVAKLELTSPSLAKPLRLSYVETWRFDSKRFKADDPHTYVRYAKKSGSWKLERAKS